MAATGDCAGIGSLTYKSTRTSPSALVVSSSAHVHSLYRINRGQVSRTRSHANSASIMASPVMAPPPLQPGQQPTPEQIQQMQRQLAEEAAKRGLTVPQYVEQLKQQAMRQHQMQQQAMAQQQAQQQQQAQMQQAQMQQQQQVPINNGPPKPEAIAVADFLRSQELKPRTCILHEKRKDMFKGSYTTRRFATSLG